MRANRAKVSKINAYRPRFVARWAKRNRTIRATKHRKGVNMT